MAGCGAAGGRGQKAALQAVASPRMTAASRPAQVAAGTGDGETTSVSRLLRVARSRPMQAGPPAHIRLPVGAPTTQATRNRGNPAEGRHTAPAPKHRDTTLAGRTGRVWGPVPSHSRHLNNSSGLFGQRLASAQVLQGAASAQWPQQGCALPAAARPCTQPIPIERRSGRAPGFMPRRGASPPCSGRPSP